MSKRFEDLIMKSNIMVIGNGKEKVGKKAELILSDALTGGLNETVDNDREAADREPSRESIQGQVYDNDWGNEHAVLEKLEGKMLADRRFYARALYMQRIKCTTLYDSVVSEPFYLSEPIEFMIIDLSIGGIGVICEHELMPGTILSFNLTLDHIEYGIRCEVAYGFENSDKYRAGLRLVDRDVKFIRHLKIFVARLTLQSKYGARI